MSTASVGLIGLAVMGENLARNIERNGFRCAVYNRTYSKTEAFMAAEQGKNFVSSESIEGFVESLERPRKIILMVKAGRAVDSLLKTLLPLLEPGDIILDGGNAHFPDTVRREKECKDAGVFFLGVGISGGEEGALHGASIMPGGDRQAWEEVSPILEKISAVAEGQPCTTFIGPDGAGHFVKMVHNGIEYADMQLIAEIYDVLYRGGGLAPATLARTFRGWNDGVLNSFLIEITGRIFEVEDPEGEGMLIDKILDAAGQKGTGRWTAQTALDLGVAIPSISAAVDARILSSLKAERVNSEPVLGPVVRGGKVDAPALSEEALLVKAHDALYSAKIIAYAQGMALMGTASAEYSWDLQLGEIAAIWRGGCIIRAKFLNDITAAYRENASLPNLLMAERMREELSHRVESLRETVSYAVTQGIPVPALSSSLAYADAYATARLPQNLTQAQRDFFGAHTYKRLDKEGVFHTEWEG